MLYLYIGTALAVAVSFITDRRKTAHAFKMAAKKFINILPDFLLMLTLVSLILYLLPDTVILKYLGTENLVRGLSTAALLGSITLLPGFIAFPLSGLLLHKGVTYMVLSAFTTTMMMVGVVTFPIERAYFGTKVTIVRNLFSLIIALCVALATGIFFGEIHL